MNRLSIEFYILASPPQLIGTIAIFLHGTIGGRHLHYVALKLFQYSLYPLLCYMLSGKSGIDWMLHIVTGRGGTKLQGGSIFLGVVLQGGYHLGTLTCAEYQHPSGERVESACMTSLYTLHSSSLRDASANECQCTKAGHAIRLVDM